MCDNTPVREKPPRPIPSICFVCNRMNPPSMKRCQQCGTRYPDTQNFCDLDGRELTEERDQPLPPPSPRPSRPPEPLEPFRSPKPPLLQPSEPPKRPNHPTGKAPPRIILALISLAALVLVAVGLVLFKYISPGGPNPPLKSTTVAKGPMPAASLYPGEVRAPEAEATHVLAPILDNSFRQIGNDGTLGFLRTSMILGGQPTPFLAARVDPLIHHLAIVTPSTPEASHPSPKSSYVGGGYTLAEFAKDFNASVVISGGYMNSFAPPVPLGLVKSAGVVLNGPHNSWLFNGLICVAQTQVQIEPYSNVDQTIKCRDSLQAGQLLVQNGRKVLVVDDRNNKLINVSQERAFVCTDAGHRVIMGVTGKMEEMPLADLLLRPPFNCVDAISLSGQATAGILILNIGANGQLGSTGSPLPNAIIVE